MPATLPPQAAHDATAAAAPGRRRRQRQQFIWAAQASYGIDWLLLCALSLAGGLPMGPAMAYLAAGTAAGALFYVLLSNGWSERFQDPYLAGPQMLLHAAINIGLTVLVPQIGLLTMMVLFVIFAFGALRVNARSLWSGPTFGALGIALAVVLMVLLVGDRLGMPTATPAQRALCGVWLALNLGRCTLVGLYSARLRILLTQRHGELAAALDKLETLASRDELTGSLNRRSVMQLLEEERQRMQRTGQAFGVALLDLDHFKQVNDHFGHLVGDETLRRFTLCAAACMRNTDRLGRYGGEEFLLLLTATSDEAAAQVAADRVRDGTARYHWAAIAPGLQLTVSAGVAICRPGESTEHLLQRADTALYAAKNGGRNCVRVG